jgi:hypothetical protein
VVLFLFFLFVFGLEPPPPFDIETDIKQEKLMRETERQRDGEDCPNGITEIKKIKKKYTSPSSESLIA